MKTLSACRRWSLCLLVLLSSFANARAGGNAAPGENQVGPAAGAAQMDTYLQSQKLKFAIEMTDPKDAAERAAQGPLAIRVYGDLADTQQEAITATLTGAAKKTRTEGSTLMFYALEHTVAAPVFMASSLPSGNGSVSFGQSGPSVYRLKRTVKL